MSIGRFMHNVYLGLGSNIGHREDHISLALDKLQSHHLITLISVSPLYNTESESAVPQNAYLNGAAHITTILTPLELLDVTESIETDMGRYSKGLGDPRIIDIDILFYDNDIISTDRLNIPHVLAHERGFVLDPMHDIAPDYCHPILSLSIAELKSQRHGY
jgi:2-amino-4-hydroxy-6-hydroxymethyldihydropteridine diphosphokinase